MSFHWLIPSRKGIPVLMYHRIWPAMKDRITQTPEQLEEQLVFLKQNGYEAISMQHYLEIARGKEKDPGNCVLITFDDGYYNNLNYAYPILEKLDFKASFFIIGDSLEGNTEGKDPLNRKMNAEELRSLNPQTVQLAMHGFHHENFRTTSPADIKKAILKSLRIFEDNDLPLVKAIAYPYGGRPQNPGVFKELKNWMKENGIEAAFRIGNAISQVPASDLFEIKRIDIRGTDTLETFKIKLRKGKLNPF